MSLRELGLKKSYDSDTDNIVADFYVPTLSVSIHYSRLTGFFSSTSLAIAAKGISGLIRNGGTVKIVTGATFRREDIEAIKQAIESPEKVVEKTLLRELDNIEDEFIKDHVRALGWMVANKRLKIKVAIVLDENDYPLDYRNVEKQGIFHQKVGIMEDLNGDKISFSGSDNESAKGWQNNIEEFKVFRNWVESERDYFEADLLKFKKFWDAQAKRTKVVDIPRAIEERLIEIAPNDIDELDLDRWVHPANHRQVFELRDYQKKAIENWFGNNKKGIFEMATGTGKTLTAIGCIKELFAGETKVVAVISSPFIHLSEQWTKEFNKFGVNCDKIVADSSQNKWKDTLVDSLLDIENGVSERLLVLTTHNTFSTVDFINMIRESKKRDPSQRLLLVIDEVHGIGAPQRRLGLIEEYDYRLGLSATPKRWFDLKGTEKIFNYFGDVVFEFSLRDAIKAGYLVPYIYKPHFSYLTPEEMKKYEEETRKIAKAYYRSKNEEERDEIFTLLCIKRQKIIRNARNKLAILEKILDDVKEVKYCLVYCSPHQIRAVQDILNKKNIIQHKFTEQEGIRPENKFGGLSEREFLIKQFSEGKYHALVSMKCLDEGVDVPPARLAIMLDNSGNPREYIQRRGRVLRKFPNKKQAIIHDIIVEPLLKATIPQELGELERKIIAKELDRYRDFASSAQNSSECLEIMANLEEIYGI
ncbi:DEAD/DEAH box helicase family protein [Candidatus Bathyarchaeota archaeon A05DMB-2]|nr:DEAD/DEAH box helicase family protein [Candidatus Bathyarchaeota archaeon A05DMB-2]